MLDLLSKNNDVYTTYCTACYMRATLCVYRMGTVYYYRSMAIHSMQYEEDRGASCVCDLPFPACTPLGCHMPSRHQRSAGWTGPETIPKKVNRARPGLPTVVGQSMHVPFVVSIRRGRPVKGRRAAEGYD